MLNIYAPNIDSPFDMIPASNPNVIIGGYFNCYLDPILDRLLTKPAPTIVSVQTFNDLTKTSNMVDIWRLQHPTDRFYKVITKVLATKLDLYWVASHFVMFVCF